MSFKIGDKAALKWNPQNILVVVGISQNQNTPGNLLLEATDAKYNNVFSMSENELLSIEEAQNIAEENKVAREKMEAAFNLIKPQILAKIREADDALGEAKALASDHNRPLESISEMQDLLSNHDLQWYSSSANC